MYYTSINTSIKHHNILTVNYLWLNSRMEEAAKYLATPPLLRPLNPDEHRENKQLSAALAQAKIAAIDLYAELRMMHVAVDVLTTRALKAEAALEVEQAKTALLWPVATKQTPSTI